MKCIECGRSVDNWPHWLEESRVTVRCARCASASATPINLPTEHTTLEPLTVLAHRAEELTEAA
jgi:hypothetical protein